MRASTFICTNIEEIEMVKEENEKLNLPSPQPLPKPTYEESVGWFHIEDVTRAYTRNINNKAVASLVFSDGSYMDVKMTSEMEDMLDILFRNTL
jgi:hypothetical protein